jgi:hypothetical protein
MNGRLEGVVRGTKPWHRLWKDVTKRAAHNTSPVKRFGLLSAIILVLPLLRSIVESWELRVESSISSNCFHCRSVSLCDTRNTHFSSHSSQSSHGTSGWLAGRKDRDRAQLKPMGFERWPPRTSKKEMQKDQVVDAKIRPVAHKFEIDTKLYFANNFYL